MGRYLNCLFNALNIAKVEKCISSLRENTRETFLKRSLYNVQTIALKLMKVIESWVMLPYTILYLCAPIYLLITCFGRQFIPPKGLYIDFIQQNTCVRFQAACAVLKSILAKALVVSIFREFWDSYDLTHL